LDIKRLSLNTPTACCISLFDGFMFEAFLLVVVAPGWGLLLAAQPN
jgi:hypothetical protein